MPPLFRTGSRSSRDRPTPPDGVPTMSATLTPVFSMIPKFSRADHSDNARQRRDPNFTMTQHELSRTEDRSTFDRRMDQLQQAQSSRRASKEIYNHELDVANTQSESVRRRFKATEEREGSDQPLKRVPIAGHGTEERRKVEMDATNEGVEPAARRHSEAESLRERVGALWATLDKERAEKGRMTEEMERQKENIDQLREELGCAQADRDKFHQNWKNSIKELRQLARPAQGTAQVTDETIIQWVKQLRYDIQNFAIRYFESDKPRVNSPQARQESAKAGMFHYMEETTPGSEHFQEFLASPSRRSAVVQAFLWRFMAREVFSNFTWAGKLSIPIFDLYTSFRQESTNKHPIPDAEALKRLRLWTVTTTRLAIDLVTSEGNTVAQVKEIKSLVQKQRVMVHDVIGPFLEVKKDCFAAYLRDLKDILDRATLMDRDICKQAADLTWDFGGDEIPSVFDEETMLLGREEQLPSTNGWVVLVIAPAMYKTGKFSGDDFGKPKQLLVEMEVTCKPVEDALF